MRSVWEPFRLGDIALEHRLAMAPMTRSRAAADGTPVALTAEYYAQRASLGLIVTEGTQPSADGQGYRDTPGLYTDAHVAGWRTVADAVHAAGGRLVIQLMHVGRVAHPDNVPHDRPAVAPSAVRPDAGIHTAAGHQPIPVPRALEADEIPGVVDEFRRAALAAVAAGADGVEIHGANGYLVHQFLSDNANRRTDAYGGPVEHRIRFAVEVTAAVADAIGPGRTGIHLSPANPLNDIAEDDPRTLYRALLEALAPLDIGWVQVVHPGDEELVAALRAAWPGGFVLNRADADLETRLADVQNGRADVTSFARMALANSDLVDRIRRDAPLNEPDPKTFYGGGAEGYTDYPPQPLPGDDRDRGLAVARPGSADAELDHLAVVGDTYTILLRGRDTAGRHAVIDMLIPPGGGPPPHRHDFEETFHVLEGAISVTLRDDAPVVAAAGDTVNVPANAPHTFANHTDAPTRMLCVVAPAGLEEFFAGWGDPVASRTSPAPALGEAEQRARIQRANALAPRYGIENL